MTISDEVKRRIRESFLKGTLKVCSSSAEGEVSYKPISNAFRHEVLHKRAFKVITETGKEVITTEDHSLFKLQDGRLSEIQPKNLKIGEKIVCIVDEKLVEEALVQVEQVPSRYFMYDLSVPKNESFVVNTGILAHNSYSISAVSLDIDKSSKYQALKENAETEFDKMVEQFKKSIQITRGLQQPRYGIGLSVHLGPFNKSGIVSPRNYASFNLRGGW